MDIELPAIRARTPSSPEGEGRIKHRNRRKGRQKARLTKTRWRKRHPLQRDFLCNPCSIVSLSGARVVMDRNWPECHSGQWARSRNGLVDSDVKRPHKSPPCRRHTGHVVVEPHDPPHVLRTARNLAPFDTLAVGRDMLNRFFTT